MSEDRPVYIDRVEFLSIVHNMQSSVDELVDALKKRLTLHTELEGMVGVDPSTIAAISALLVLQKEIIGQLLMMHNNMKESLDEAVQLLEVSSPHVDPNRSE